MSENYIVRAQVEFVFNDTPINEGQLVASSMIELIKELGGSVDVQINQVLWFEHPAKGYTEREDGEFDVHDITILED